MISLPQLFLKVGVEGRIASAAQLTIEPPFIKAETKLDLPQASVTFSWSATFPITEGAM